MGFFSGITNAVSDVVGGVGDIAGGLVKTAAPYAGLIGAASGVPYGALLGGVAGGLLGGAGNTQQSQQAYGNLTQGLLGTAGMMQQNKVSQEAVQAAQRQALQGGQTAANMAQFRPVGTTTNFGTSSYQFDPTTGQLTGAGYSLDPRLQSAQNTLMGNLGTNLNDAANIQAMGRQYMAASPQQQAQQYMANQQALLQPGRDTESARLANQLQQTGRTGVSVAQGGNLGMANPEQQALANARAMQDLQLASQATQAGQQQYQFGQGLLSNAYQPYSAGLAASGATEQYGQQPFTMSNTLAQQQATAGNIQGQLYNQGAQRAAAYGILPEMQTSNTANILGGLANPASQIGSAFGSLFNNWNSTPDLSIDTSGYGLGSWGNVDTAAYGGANGISIR